MQRFFVAACCVLAGIAAGAQVNGAPLPRTQQFEAGTTNLPGHGRVAYRIRLMPVSSFPQLPATVAQRLDGMGCMIPQTYEAREVENVIHGSFEKKGSSDWAALCSVKGVTTLYVFFGSDLGHPISLRHQRDTLWLGREWGQDYGSAWGIATRPARLMQPVDNADHDGLEDDFVEQLTVVHYFRNGHWATLDAGQQQAQLEKPRYLQKQ